MFSAINCASASAFLTSTMFIKRFFPFVNLVTLAFKASIPAPPLPITTPGLAVYIFNLTLLADLSISILDIPAEKSSFFTNSLILLSSIKLSANVLLSAYHFASQPLITPTLSP